MPVEHPHGSVSIASSDEVHSQLAIVEPGKGGWVAERGRHKLGALLCQARGWSLRRQIQVLHQIPIPVLLQICFVSALHFSFQFLCQAVLNLGIINFALRSAARQPLHRMLVCVCVEIKVLENTLCRSELRVEARMENGHGW